MDDLLLNDIALVKLTKPVELGRFVRTVCLPTKEEKDLAVAKKYGYAAGWGATKALKPKEKPEKADRYSTVLKYSAYTIQENRLCSNRSVLPFNSTVSILPGQIMSNTWQGKLTKGLAYLGALSIYYRLGRAFFFIKVLSCPYSSTQILFGVTSIM